MSGGIDKVPAFLIEWDFCYSEALSTATETQLIGWFLEQVESLPELAYDIMQRDRLPIGDPGLSYNALRARLDAVVNKHREKAIAKALDPLAKVRAVPAKLVVGGSDELEAPVSKAQAARIAKAERAAAAAEVLLGAPSFPKTGKGLGSGKSICKVFGIQ